MPSTNIHGREIYFEIHGDGDPIVLMHHGFGCTKMWQDIYPPLVNNGYQVIMYDRRGYGKSAGGDDFKKLYVSDTFRAESVTELDHLINFLGITSFHLIGQCEGGIIAIDYAVQFPARVKTVITSSTLCYSKVPMSDFNAVKFPHPFQELEPKLKEKLISWHGEDHAEPFYNQCRKYGGAYGKDIFDLRKSLTKVSCPSLVLYPDRSFLFEVEQGVDFYRHLAAGELAVLPKCGHNTYEYQPKAYVRHVLDFLTRHHY